MRLPKAGGRVGFYRSCSITGVSDILGVLPDGRFLAVELKKVGGRVRENQRAFLDAVTRKGGLALVVDGIDALDRALRFEGY